MQEQSRITCLIVDDEPIARAGLRQMLRQHHDIDIVGEAGSFNRARLLIEELSPRVVFLDVGLPDGDGLNIVDPDIPGHLARPIFIVASAYGYHALRGFEVGVEDYIMKPFSEERIAQALSKVRDRIRLQRLGIASNYANRSLAPREEQSPRSGLKETGAIDGITTRIFMRDGAKWIAVDFSEIQCVESAGDYVCISTDSHVVVGRETLKRIADLLPTPMFLQVHRSRIVRTDAIRSIEAKKGGLFAIHMAGGTVMQSSKSYRNEIIEVLKGRFHALG